MMILFENYYVLFLGIFTQTGDIICCIFFYLQENQDEIKIRIIFFSPEEK